VLVVMAGGIAGTMVYRSLAEGLPELDELETYQSSLVTHLYDRHGEMIANFFTEKRILVELEDIPQFVRDATVAVEDSRFYTHSGIDPKGVLRAAWTNYQAGRVVEGASTITMQVARTLFLNRDRTWRRKLREMILAWRIEQRFSKDEIMKMYLNQVFYGHNAFGIEAAAQIYFDKSAKDLTLGEGALIVGLTRAPNTYSPLHNLSRFQLTDQALEQLQAEGVPLSVLHNLHGLKDQPVMEETAFLERLKTALGAPLAAQYEALVLRHSNYLKLTMERREHVVRRMVDEGYLTPEQARRAIEEPIQTSPNYRTINKAPYFVEYVRRYLEKKYGAKALYEGGWNVYTTLDLNLQRMAEQALRRGVEEADKRQGYQRPFRRLALTGDGAVDRPLIEQITLPPNTDPVVHSGEVLTGVVSVVSPGAVWVKVKGGQGVMSPDEGFGWVREVNLDHRFEDRQRLAPEDIFSVGDVIQVRVVSADERNQAHLLVLEQEPLLEGSLIALEPDSGHVVAMVGGYEDTNQYNRAVQAYRQPGSAFKPFVYTAALAAGKTAASVIYDRAVVIGGGDDETWKPQNYSQRYYGATTLRTALARSRNTVTVRLMEHVGVEPVRDVAKRMGIESELDPYMSLALGSSEVNLLELTAAYGTFANGGLTVPPVFITRIVGPNREVVEDNLPQAHRAISPELAYVMTSLMQGVIQEGTGQQAKALGRPAAGKTGTTDDFRDAWFLGFTPELVTGVWVGFDDGTSLGRHESGGRVASPIWLEFMKRALKGRPITDFSVPPDVRFYRIDAETGREVSGNTEGKTRFEAFTPGTAPAPPASPVVNIREKINRLDQQRSTVRTLEEMDRIRQQ
jgi:penicillin-binding protein 1A